jgi:hypothetical protein
MTTVAELERSIDADPLDDALASVVVFVPTGLPAAVRSRSHTRLAHRRRHRLLTRTVAGVAVLCLVAFTPPGHALARLVLPEGLQQRLGLVEGSPRTLTPPAGAVRPANTTPIPCSTLPTPAPGHPARAYACYPDLSIAAAQAKVDFGIATPAAIPPGLQYRGAVTSGNQEVQLFWGRANKQPGTIGLEIRGGVAQSGGSAVPSGTVQRVSVGGSPGYVVRGDYESTAPGDAAHWNPNADDYELTWVHDGLTYDLTAGNLHFTVADVVRLAESVG